MLISFKNHKLFKAYIHQETDENKKIAFLENYRDAKVLPVGIFEEYRNHIYNTYGAANSINLIRSEINTDLDGETNARDLGDTTQLLGPKDYNGRSLHLANNEIRRDVDTVYNKSIEFWKTSVKSVANPQGGVLHLEDPKKILSHLLVKNGKCRELFAKRMIWRIVRSIENSKAPGVDLNSINTLHSTKQDHNLIIIDSYCLFAIGHVAYIDGLLKVLRRQERKTLVFILYDRLMSVLSDWVFRLSANYETKNIEVKVINNDGYCVNLSYLKETIGHTDYMPDDATVTSKFPFHAFNPFIDFNRLPHYLDSKSH